MLAINFLITFNEGMLNRYEIELAVEILKLTNISNEHNAAKLIASWEQGRNVVLNNGIKMHTLCYISILDIRIRTQLPFHCLETQIWKDKTHYLKIYDYLKKIVFNQR
jgi:hypothetical protein